MPPKPVLEIDMVEFHTMQKLMIKAQDKAKRNPAFAGYGTSKLKQQLADTKGIFKVRSARRSQSNTADRKGNR